MKKVIVFLLVLMAAVGARAQTFTPIHNATAVDYISMVKYFGIPYGPTPELNSTRTVPGALYYRTTDSCIYVWTGTQWLKNSAPFPPSTDSIVPSNTSICVWSGGVPVCVYFTRYYDSSALNWDSSYTKHFNNGNFLDSVWNAHETLFFRDGVAAADTTDEQGLPAHVIFGTGGGGGGGGGVDSFAFRTIVATSDTSFTISSYKEDYLITISGGPGGMTSIGGDIIASGIGAVTATLPTVNSNVGTFNNITINAKGQAIAGSNVSYLTANQSITVTATGDATGVSSSSPTAPSLGLTLSTVNSNVGSFTNANITVDAKGRITAASSGASGGSVSISPGLAIATSPNPITGTGTVSWDSSSTVALSRQRAAATYQIILTGTTGSLLYYNGTNYVPLSAGTSAQHLTGGAVPSWKDTTVGSAGGGLSDSLYFWKLGGTWATAGSHFLGTKNNVSMRFRVNNSEFMMADSSTGSVGINAAASTLAKLYVNGTIWAQGPSGVGYKVTNGTGIRGVGTGATTWYIDGNDGLTGTIDLRSTTFLVEAALTANSVNSTSFVNSSLGGGLRVGGVDAVGTNTDSTLMRFNDNIYVRKIGIRAANTVFNDDNQSPILWNNPAASAILELKSTTKAFLPPRMTKAQRDAIVLTGVGDGNAAMGTGYTNGAYPTMSLTGGTGAGATAKITVLGNHITYVSIIAIGTGYTIGDVLTAAVPGGTGFTYTLTTLSATPGMTIYQTDNTPGIRIWNGTNWMKFTETAD